MRYNATIPGMLWKSNRLKSAAAYTGSAVLCLGILTWLMKLWQADLRIPFRNGPDTLFHSMIIKGMLDNFWFLQNRFVGMPTGQELYDFPMTDNFHFLVLKLFSLFLSDYGRILNVFFLLTFPAVTLSALYVFRQFNFSYLVSIAGSLLYSFLPFHFLRGENNLFLSAYYTIPFMVIVVLWACAGAFVPDGAEQTMAGLRSIFSSRKFIGSIFICLLIASTGWVYFAFFGACFLLVAGIYAAIATRTFRHLLAPLLLTVVISTGLAASLSPSLWYLHKHGDTGIAKRYPAEAELYGLKIAQLLLPITGHRLKSFANLKDRYNTNPFNNENDCSSLGAIASFGFLFLLGRLAYKKSTESLTTRNENYSTLNHLTVLNLAAVLLGTIGGFGSIFALVVTPQLRTYNRVSIYIAFFALFSLVGLVDRFYKECVKTSRQRVAFYALLLTVVYLGILDQTSRAYAPDHKKLKAEYQADADFVKKIEESQPKNSMIFQLPYAPFPESPKINRMADYEHIKAYLHSHALRWSYGAIKGREADLWQETTAAKSLSEMLKAISLAGFSGIYIDRYGYADNGLAAETQITELLSTRPFENNSGRLVFFDMTAFNSRLRRMYSPEDWEAKHSLAIHPVMPSWREGFSDLESTADVNFRWCSSEGELQIWNTYNQARRVVVEMTLATGSEGFANMSVQGPGFSENLKIDPAGTPYKKELSIAPGTTSVRFTCDAQRVYAPADPRVLVFKVVNFKFTEID
jgi:hypothetical protein